MRSLSRKLSAIKSSSTVGSSTSFRLSRANIAAQSSYYLQDGRNQWQNCRINPNKGNKKLYNTTQMRIYSRTLWNKALIRSYRSSFQRHNLNCSKISHSTFRLLNRGTKRKRKGRVCCKNTSRCLRGWERRKIASIARSWIGLTDRNKRRWLRGKSLRWVSRRGRSKQLNWLRN